MPASVIISTVAGFAFGAGSAAAFTSAALFAGLKAGLVIGALTQVTKALTKPKRRQLQVGTADRGTVNQTVNGPERARWVIGRARVAGQIVFLKENPQNNKELHMLQVFSSGACDGVEKVWVDSRDIPLQRNIYRNGQSIEIQSGDYRDGGLEITFSLDGLGSNNTNIQAVFGEWTANHRLQGLSYMHVVLTQPPKHLSLIHI